MLLRNFYSSILLLDKLLLNSGIRRVMWRGLLLIRRGGRVLVVVGCLLPFPFLFLLLFRRMGKGRGLGVVWWMNFRCFFCGVWRVLFLYVDVEGTRFSGLCKFARKKHGDASLCVFCLLLAHIPVEREREYRAWRVLFCMWRWRVRDFAGCELVTGNSPPKYMVTRRCVFFYVLTYPWRQRGERVQCVEGTVWTVHRVRYTAKNKYLAIV